MALSLLLAGCANEPTGSERVAGTYGLASIDGAPLPFVLNTWVNGEGSTSDVRFAVLADTIRLAADGRFQRLERYGSIFDRPEGGADTLEVLTDSPGRYEQRGALLVLEEIDLTSGAPTGVPDTLEIRGASLVARRLSCQPPACADPQLREWVYRR